MLPLCCRRKQYMALYALALALCTLGLIVHVSVGFPYSLNTDKLSDIDSSDGESRVFRRVLKSIRTKDDIDNGNIKDLQGKNFLKNINASHSNIDDADFWSLNSSLPFDLWDFNVSRRQHDNSTTMPCTNSSNGPRAPGRVYCDMQWDGLSCWPATPGGRYSIIECPVMNGIDPTKNASKFCHSNGSWEARADYNSCIAALANPDHDNWSAKELDSDYAKRIIYNLGFMSSTLALSIALFIFLYFRSLRCLRNQVHSQLIVTFILRNLLWILMQHSLIPIVNSEHKWACKLETAIFNYVQMTNFFWMLVEGLYLHIIIVWTFSADKIKLWYFVIIGWGIPVVVISVWIALRIHFQRDLNETSHLLACWMPTNGSNAQLDQLDWIYNGPILFVLATNMLFLATIIWVLVTKLRASHSLETRQLRKAVKATLLLFPLLGIIYVLFIWPPSDAPAVIEAHQFINAVLQSFQGFFVSLFYCFLNGEVKSVLKKKFNVFQDSRSLSARYTKSTIGWANDTSITPNYKDSVALSNGKLTTGDSTFRPNTPAIEQYPEETENML